MRLHRPIPVALTLVLLLGACSGVSSLAEDPPALPPDQLRSVQSKSQQAFVEGAWVTAWDEAVRASASRERLEEIALETMAPLDPVKTPPTPGAALKMFDALRDKYGGLTAGARARVTERRVQYLAKERWTDALELELASADDPPGFSGAWAVYDASPVWKSTAIRERINEAEVDYEERRAEALTGSDG